MEIVHNYGLMLGLERYFLLPIASMCTEGICIMSSTNPTDTEWAYLAGFIDGEGYIGAVKSGYNVRVRILQKNSSVLESLVDDFPVGNLTRRRFNGKFYPIWQIQGAREVAWLLEGCLPYLRLKKDQAEIAIYLANNRRAISTEEGQAMQDRLSELKHVRH